jgi:hypothetical protein
MAEFVRGKCKVIAVNNQGIPTCVKGILEPALAPWADVLYGADQKWWECYWNRALAFPGLKVTMRSRLAFKEVYSLYQSEQRVFDERPTHIVSGGNSGYQALHLAAQFGSKRILLCGYDMVSSDKRRHNHDNHPGKLDTRGNYAKWIPCFGLLAPVLKAKGIQVFNCSPKSALKMFPKADLQQCLK